MVKIRKLSSIFAVQSSDPVLLLSQYRALAGQVPVLYTTLILNMMVLSATHYMVAPVWLTVAIPCLFVAAGIRRILSWRSAGRSEITPAKALAALRRTTWVTGILTTAFMGWAMLLYPYGDAFRQTHVIYYATINAIPCVFCLMYVPSAAFLVVTVVAVPTLIFMMFTSQPVLIAISVNFVLVSVCMVKILMRNYGDFVALHESRQQLIVRQAETQELSNAFGRLAHLDALTGLPNRRSFFLDLDGVLDRHPPGTTAIAIGLIDLDGFKPVNDVFGHAAGDAVLQEVGRRIIAFMAQASPLARATFARLGGDEFGFILSGQDDAETMEFARSLCQALRAPYLMASTTAELSASIGVAIFPQAGQTAAVLIERADYALYYAKQNRRGEVVLFSLAHQSEIRETARIDQALRHADLEAELFLVFQPIFDADRAETISFECLARWRSPELGLVQPNDFIKVAERSGIINRLTEVLLRKALTEAATWPPHMRITFNLSVRDLASEESIRKIIEIVRTSDVAPARIEFEITETAVMRDFDQARQALLSLKEIGVGIALDDFGTGYSSLSYVHRLPLDKIKVDRSFTADLETDPACLNIIKTVIDLSRNLKLLCVVEGLETVSQVRILKMAGCFLMQGYFFAKPMTAEAVQDYLEAEARRIEQGAGYGVIRAAS